MHKKQMFILPPGTPEFAVDRATLSEFFQPPISKSTFHDLVSKGAIIPVREVRGFYRLNESLIRLGLQPVFKQVTRKIKEEEQLCRWGLSMIDSSIFPLPGWLLFERPSEEETRIASLIAGLHRSHLEALKTVEEKIAYGAGVIEAHLMLSMEEDESAGT